MENHDKTGSEVHGLIQVEKHTGDDAVDCMKKAIKERAFMQEKVPELRVNRKDTMAMDDIDEFERHRSSTLHGIFIAAGRAEAAVTAERDEFQFSAVRTAVHSAAKGRIATVYHLIDIFHLSIPGVEGIYDFFVMVSKNFLEDIHKTIM